MRQVLNLLRRGAAAGDNFAACQRARCQLRLSTDVSGGGACACRKQQGRFRRVRACDCRNFLSGRWQQQLQTQAPEAPPNRELADRALVGSVTGGKTLPSSRNSPLHCALADGDARRSAYNVDGAGIWPTVAEDSGARNFTSHFGKTSRKHERIHYQRCHKQ